MGQNYQPATLDITKRIGHSVFVEVRGAVTGYVYFNKSALGKQRSEAFRRRIGFLSCQEVVDYCLGLPERLLPAPERQLFSSHLRNCPDCMKFFETYRRTPEVSREAMALRMPDRVRSAVRDFLRDRYELSVALRRELEQRLAPPP